MIDSDELNAYLDSVKADIVIPQVSSIRSRANRRRRVRITAGTAAVALIALAATILTLHYSGRDGTQSVRIARTSTPSPSASTSRSPSPSPPGRLNVTARYLPFGYKFLNVERHSSTGVAGAPLDEVDKRYVVRSGRNLPPTKEIIVEVLRGDVNSVRQAHLDNLAHKVTVAGRRGRIGWNTGTPGVGLDELYVITSPHIAIDIVGFGPATYSTGELIRVAAGAHVER